MCVDCTPARTCVLSSDRDLLGPALAGYWGNRSFLLVPATAGHHVLQWGDLGITETPTSSVANTTLWETARLDGEP